MTQKMFRIYAVSDATGDLAHSQAVAAAGQFPATKVEIIRRPLITTQQEIASVVSEAKKEKGVVLFTMVSHHLRQLILSEAKDQGVVAMDIMGPALDMLSHYFHQLPSDEPGLQYKHTRDYYKRTEAVEFTFRHDDGLGIDTINQADIVLLGVSRTSKTPLAIYLAYHGYRCANIPIIKAIPLQQEVYQIDQKKLVGLDLSAEKLATMRSTRLQKLGRPSSEDYAQIEHVEEELKHAHQIFNKFKEMLVIDVTGKAIEEIAAEILHGLKL